MLVPDAEATIPAIRGLLGLARASRMHVVYSQDTHRAGDPEWAIWPEHCREGSWGWEIVAELTPAAEDTVLHKFRYDAFYGTPLDHLLRLWGVDTARHLRHPRQPRRALHRGERRPPLVRRRDPARRDLSA